ncbi:unnamed protein product [Rhizophagus irregularis]|nr:unnamed protein product [Rhizophagus irregularis]
MSISDTAALCQEQANSTARSELEVLRRRNAELEAELEAEREEKKIIASSFMEEIDKLKKKNADLFTENFDLKREIANFRKEQELKNTELEDRLVKVEQSSSADSQPRDRVNNTSSSAENGPAFLIEEHKKDITPIECPFGASEEIGKPVSQGYTSDNSEEIGKPVSQGYASEEIGKPVSQGYTSDNSEEIGKTVNLVNDQDNSVEGPEGPEGPGPEGSDIVTEFVQGWLEELLSSDDPLQTIKFSSPKTSVPGSISIKRLANSFCQANDARNRSIAAKREEITAWRLFSERFEDKVVELRSNDKKLTDQTARKRIYNEMKPYLTDQVKSKTITSRVSETNEEMLDDDESDIDFGLDDEILDDKSECRRSISIALLGDRGNPSTALIGRVNIYFNYTIWDLVATLRQYFISNTAWKIAGKV